MSITFDIAIDPEERPCHFVVEQWDKRLGYFVPVATTFATYADALAGYDTIEPDEDGDRGFITAVFAHQAEGDYSVNLSNANAHRLQQALGLDYSGSLDADELRRRIMRSHLDARVEYYAERLLDLCRAASVLGRRVGWC